MGNTLWTQDMKMAEKAINETIAGQEDELMQAISSYCESPSETHRSAFKVIQHASRVLIVDRYQPTSDQDLREAVDNVIQEMRSSYFNTPGALKEPLAFFTDAKIQGTAETIRDGMKAVAYLGIIGYLLPQSKYSVEGLVEKTQA